MTKFCLILKFKNKMKNKKYHTFGTFTKSNWKVVETKPTLILPNAKIEGKKPSKYLTVGTFPKSNRKFTERGNIDTPYTKYITDHISGLVHALQYKVAVLN